MLDLGNATLDTLEIVILDDFRRELHQLILGCFFLSLRSSLVINDRLQLALQTLIPLTYFTLLVCFLCQIFKFVVITVTLFHLFLELLVLAVLLVVKQQDITHIFALFFGKSVERMKIGFIIVNDSLVDDDILQFRGQRGSLKDQEDE